MNDWDINYVYCEMKKKHNNWIYFSNILFQECYPIWWEDILWLSRLEWKLELRGVGGADSGSVCISKPRVSWLWEIKWCEEQEEDKRKSPWDSRWQEDCAVHYVNASKGPLLYSVQIHIAPYILTSVDFFFYWLLNGQN